MNKGKTLFIHTIIGIFVGLIIGVFKEAIGLVSGLMDERLLESSGDILNKIIFIGLILIIGLITYLILKKDPDTKGSGIPVMMGQMDGEFDVKSEKTIINKFITSVLTIGSGLTVGREGPSVQLGGLGGDLVGKVFKEKSRRYLIGSGAAAAFAVAFNAPLAAMVFAIEEVFKEKSAKVFLKSTVSVIAATLTANIIFGNLPALVDIPKFETFNLLDIELIALMGLITGLSGVVFNKIVIGSKDVYARIKAPGIIKYLVPFLITGLVLLYDGRLFASGEELIYLPSLDSMSLKTLVYFYLANILLLSLAFGAGLSGGSLVPLLAIGAILGNIYGTALYKLGLISFDMVFAYSLIAMAGHLAAIVRTPITAVILIFEMTGGAFMNLMPLIIASLISYIIAEVCGSKPFYDDLYERLLRGNKINK